MEKTGVVVVGSHVQGLFMRVTRFPAADETVHGWDYKEALDGGKGSTKPSRVRDCILPPILWVVWAMTVWARPGLGGWLTLALI